MSYDRLIAVSDSTRKAWVRKGFPDALTEVIPNGVDCSRFYPARREERMAARSRFDVPKGAKVLLSVGRLHIGMKGTDDVLRTLSRLDSEWCALIAGSGPDEGKLRELAKVLKISDRVRFCGLVSPILDCYHAADVLVVTSHYEPFGLMAVEAMSSGLPIVAFETEGGLMEVLAKTDATVIQDRDLNAMATAIEALDVPRTDESDDAKTRHDTAVAEYSWDKAAETLAHSYFEFSSNRPK